jgi:hypothetical protein
MASAPHDIQNGGWFHSFQVLIDTERHLGISPPLEAKDLWNAMEIDYHYPHPRLELRRGGTDEEALVRSTCGQTFLFPTSGGEVVAGISLNPAASVWDGRGPGSSSSSASTRASSQPLAALGSVRATPDGDVPVIDLGPLERMQVLTIQPGTTTTTITTTTTTTTTYYYYYY